MVAGGSANAALCGRVGEESNKNYAFSKTTSLKQPSKKIVISETAQYAKNSDGVMMPTGYGYWRILGGFTNAENTGWGHPASRHDSRCNAVHLDGHVEAYTVPQVTNPWIASPFNDKTYMRADD